MSLSLHTPSDLAPIALFVYNRPSHTRKTVAALQKNALAQQSELYIFSDAPKHALVLPAVQEVRQYLKSIQGFKRVTLIERSENYGLSRSVISGVSELLSRYERVIVLEDDLVTSPYFLLYMNEALNLYAKEDRVASIHGYMYPVREVLPETFFLHYIDCWGWGTWKRAWDLFEQDGEKLLAELLGRKLTRQFDLNYSYHFTLILKEQLAGLNNSWAIRWYASLFLKGKLGLYPANSLVKNIGLDNSGSHTGAARVFDVDLSNEPVAISKIPVVANVEVAKIIQKYFKSPMNLAFFGLMRVKNGLRLVIRKLLTRIWI